MAAAAARPASRYPSLDSRSSTASTHLSSPSPDRKNNPRSKISSLKRLITNSSGSRAPLDPTVADSSVSSSSSRALARAKSGDPAVRNGQNFVAMVTKFMEKSSKPKPGSADRMELVIPPNRIAEDIKKAAAAAGGGKCSNFTALHKKLFQKGVGSGDRTAGKVLTEVKTNTRTLAMVLRSERELLSQNKEYGVEISELRLLVEQKNREVDKLKDLCLKQREEIKALKNAILFPDVMNAQLQLLLEKQGSELNQAKQVIPSLQKQVSSLTGQLQCLAEDLAEVKADKYAGRSCFDGHVSSPRTPIYDQETANSLEFSSAEHITPGSPDDMFLKDLNPCLTPCFSKSKSKEYDEMMGYDSSLGGESLGNSTVSSSDVCFSSQGGNLSRSSEHCQRPSLRNTMQKTRKSDESRQFVGKSTYQNPFRV